MTLDSFEKALEKTDIDICMENITGACTGF